MSMSFQRFSVKYLLCKTLKTINCVSFEGLHCSNYQLMNQGTPFVLCENVITPDSEHTIFLLNSSKLLLKLDS